MLTRRTTRPGPIPGSEPPLEWRYSEREWRALELYDRWLCGEVLTTEQRRVEMRTDDGTSAGTVRIKAVDARYPAASPGNVLAFIMHGASGAIACSALTAGKGEYPALNGAGGRAPSPAEVMQLMVNAARAGLDKQRGLDELAGRGF
eukprot:scaffold77685_cov84-Phaeocystis_antarctica.AAC.1